jgi:predicted 3-demethylubiquinone-9 3-methyltransferase (glyoxalase superfamily)
MAQTVTPFLMFEGVAEEAMKFYVLLFNGEIVSVTRYGRGEPGAEGSIKRADFTLAGQHVICIDSAVKHEFTFTPAMSLFVECASENELDQVFCELSANGKVLMPPGNYGFSVRFAWINDRFGVSWQLNFAKPAETLVESEGVSSSSESAG